MRSWQPGFELGTADSGVRCTTAGLRDLLFTTLCSGSAEGREEASDAFNEQEARLRRAHGGATTTGPDATHPQLSFKPRGGGGGGAVGGGSRWGSGGVFLPGVRGGGCSCRGSGGVWPGVMGASSQG